MDKKVETTEQKSQDKVYIHTGRGVEGQAAALACVNFLRQIAEIPGYPKVQAWLVSRQNGSYAVGCELPDEVPF